MEITADILQFVLYGRWKTPLTARLTDHNIQSYTDCPPVPLEVRISPTTMPGGHLGAYCARPIRAGTDMGPYVGAVIDARTLNPAGYNTTVWELFDQRWEVTDYIAGEAGWLAYIQCARTDDEQNLEIVQRDRQIFYRATRDIEPGEELLVWYSDRQPLYMGIPCTAPSPPPRGHTPASSLDGDTDIDERRRPPIAVTNTKRKCTICGRGFNSRSNLRSHMRTHTLEKPFCCSHCGRKFSQSSTLRNHVRLHTGERPYMCAVCKSRYSQLAGLRAHQRSAAHRAIRG